MVQKTGVNNNVYPRSRAHFDSLLIIYKLKRLPDVCGVMDVKL